MEKVILMNKEVPVAEMKIDFPTGYMFQVKWLNKEYAPVGIQSVPELKKWWQGRSIPASRDKLKEFVKILDINTPLELLEKSFGLSLSDQYWMKPVEKNIEWKDINFFRNDFSEDIGNVIMFQKKQTNAINFFSPDNSSDGWLKKKWIIQNQKRYLLKAGSEPFFQEPFNECVTSELLKNSTIEHVHYSLLKLHFNNTENFVSKCENFITENTEYVPAYCILRMVKRKSSDSDFTHFKKCMDYLQIPKSENFIEQMLMLDYIICNRDRHYGNFGFIRDVNTLKFISPAPLFDNGTSFWNNMLHVNLSHDEARPFKKSHKKQILLIKSFDNFPFKKLQTFPDIAKKIFATSSYLNEERVNNLCKILKERISSIEKIVSNSKGLCM